MYTLYKFHFLNGISEINQLFDDILIIWPAPVWLTDAVPFITGSGSVPFLGISVKTTHSARTISAHITALRPQSPGCLITCHDRLCGSISLICSLKSSCVAVYSALIHWLCPSFRIHLFVPPLFKKVCKTMESYHRAQITAMWCEPSYSHWKMGLFKETYEKLCSVCCGVNSYLGAKIFCYKNVNICYWAVSTHAYVYMHMHIHCMYSMYDWVILHSYATELNQYSTDLTCRITLLTC